MRGHRSQGDRDPGIGSRILAFDRGSVPTLFGHNLAAPGGVDHKLLSSERVVDHVVLVHILEPGVVVRYEIDVSVLVAGSVVDSGVVIVVHRRPTALQREGPTEGPGLCSSDARVPTPRTLPGASVEISVRFRAPSLPRSCYTGWKIVDAEGRYS